MGVAYIAVTILASAFTGFAAVTYLIGHDYPKAQIDMKRRYWESSLPRGSCSISSARSSRTCE